MGADIDCGAAEERPEGQEEEEEAGGVATGEDEDDGGDADMAAGEGGRGALTGFLGASDELVEEAVGPARRRQGLEVGGEIGAEGREMARHDLRDAYGTEIVLGTCYGEKDVDEVEEEEGEENASRYATCK